MPKSYAIDAAIHAILNDTDFNTCSTIELAKMPESPAKSVHLLELVGRFL